MMAGCGTMVRDFYRDNPGDYAALIMICQPWGSMGLAERTKALPPDSRSSIKRTAAQHIESPSHWLPKLYLGLQNHPSVPLPEWVRPKKIRQVPMP